MICSLRGRESIGSRGRHHRLARSLLLSLFVIFVHRARASRTRRRDFTEIMKASCSLIGLATLGWIAPAAAQPTARLSLTWNAPPVCPTDADVQARVDALLGSDASAARFADVRAIGQVERAGGGFRLLLGMGVGSAPPSSRVIEASSCDELAGAAAIAIALLARSTIANATSASPEPSPAEPPPAAAADAKKPVSAEAAPAPEPRAGDRKSDSSSARLHLAIDLPVGAASWGTMPSVGLGLRAAAGIRFQSLRVVAGGDLWRAQTSQFSGFDVHFTLQSGRLDTCLIQSTHWIELGPCAGAALQRLTGAGIRSETLLAKSLTTSWVSAVGGIFLGLQIPGFAPLRIFSQASVLVSPVRPRFVIDQLGPIHEPALAVPQLDFGCEWIL